MHVTVLNKFTILACSNECFDNGNREVNFVVRRAPTFKIREFTYSVNRKNWQNDNTITLRVIMLFTKLFTIKIFS